MDDLTKISRLELAIRSESVALRKIGGVANVRGATALDDYLQKADTASKLRFANILIDAPGDVEFGAAKAEGLRAVI